MPIENRNLIPGTKLAARYHKQTYTCEVVEGEGGKLRYRLADGREFKSPSAAGMAITGHACDGWVFWSVETATATPPTQEQPAQGAQEQEPVTPQTTEPSVSTETETKTQEEKPPTTQLATEEPGPVRKHIFRIPNQKGVPEGQTRWYCHDCGGSFLVPAGETPGSCPAGHHAS